VERLRAEKSGRDWGGKRPFRICLHRSGDHLSMLKLSILLGETGWLGRLIKLERNDGGANEHGRDGGGIGTKRRPIQTQHEILPAIQTNAPERLTKELVALAAMKLVQEILKITGRRLFVAFQPKQLRDFVVVKFVH
jgi:hypothetical protein